MKKFIAAVGMIALLFVLSAPVLSLVSVANAQSQATDPYIQRVDPPSSQGAPVTSFDSIFNFIKNILKYTAILFWIAAIFYIFLAAFTYLQAGGDPKKVGEANQRLLYAAVAIAVGLLSYGLPKLIESILTKGTT